METIMSITRVKDFVGKIWEVYAVCGRYVVVQNGVGKFVKMWRDRKSSAYTFGSGHVSEYNTVEDCLASINPNHERIEIGRALSTIRKEREVSTYQIRQKTNLSGQTINQIEDGSANYTVDSLLQYINVLGLDMVFFRAGADTDEKIYNRLMQLNINHGYSLEDAAEDIKTYFQ